MPGRLQEETAGISRKALDTWQETTLGKRLGSKGSEAKQQSCLNSGLALAVPKGALVFTVPLCSVSAAHLMQIQIRGEPGVLSSQWGAWGGLTEGLLPVPGTGPVVFAKSHKSAVLTCCCEGTVHSYFTRTLCPQHPAGLLANEAQRSWGRAIHDSVHRNASLEHTALMWLQRRLCVLLFCCLVYTYSI